jgi:hypothetical protein
VRVDFQDEKVCGKRREGLHRGNLRGGEAIVTSDLEFVFDHVLENNVKHAGIIAIPKDYNDASDGDLHTGLAYTAKLLIQGVGKNALRRHIIYIAEDGLRVLDDKGKDDLWSPFLPQE